MIPQDQFSALCALACGSGEVYTAAMKNRKVNNEVQYTTREVKKIGKDGKEYVERIQEPIKDRVVTKNNNPDGTFKTAMEAIVKGTKVYDKIPDKDPLKVMILAAQSNVFYAVKVGRYNELGKMVADGLKTNNDLLRAQLGFNSTFSAGANLIGKALQAMDKNPALKEAVEKNLDPTQLQIAKGIKALGDMQADGLHAQLEVLNHLRLPGANLDDPAFKENVAKVCCMYGMSKQFAGQKVDLVNLANDPLYPKNITSALAKNQAVTNFIDGLKTKSIDDQFKAMSTPKEMSKLFDDSAVNARQQVNQQNQPQIQLQLQVTQPQAAQPQQTQQQIPG
jgi:ferritin-like metal-binding protein YciE